MCPAWPCSTSDTAWIWGGKARYTCHCSGRLGPIRPCDDWLPPAWCSEDLRILPDPLTEREHLLLLSMWRRIAVPCLPNNCALRTWLGQKLDVPSTHGPDHGDSPHSVDRKVKFEPLRPKSGHAGGYLLGPSLALTWSPHVNNCLLYVWSPLPCRLNILSCSLAYSLEEPWQATYGSAHSTVLCGYGEFPPTWEAEYIVN